MEDVVQKKEVTDSIWLKNEKIFVRFHILANNIHLFKIDYDVDYQLLLSSCHPCLVGVSAYLVEGHNLLPRVGAAVDEFRRFFRPSALRLRLLLPQEPERERIVFFQHEPHERLP